MPPFEGELHASTPSPVAPQPHEEFVDLLLNPIQGIEVDEHCQRLSITLPADVSPGEQLPVMVWIHGGSYVIGGGDLPIYDARDLVTEQRVIVVSVTFRLGVLGFLGDGDTIPANLGLLDLVESLRWVRANIASFGGDPDLVTVFGQSAGGDAAAHLMISAGAEGLFRRAIIQSAPLGLSRRRARMNRAMIRAVGSVHADTALDDLLDRQALGTRAAAPYGLAAGMPFGTQYGFAPLPAERDLDAAWSRVAPDVDVLIGSGSDEAGMYVPLVPGLRRVTRSRVLRSALRWWVVRPLSDVIYGRDARRFTERHRRAGGRATSYRLHRGVTRRPDRSRAHERPAAAARRARGLGRHPLRPRARLARGRAPRPGLPGDLGRLRPHRRGPCARRRDPDLRPRLTRGHGPWRRRLAPPGPRGGRDTPHGVRRVVTFCRLWAAGPTVCDRPACGPRGS
ncbi:carboxylesterase family protein [Curtobacterium flaccumfaciens]|nr:carboxylesterase family protein [Curtobacterium flaccumfaciens]